MSAYPVRKATADAASLRFGLAPGSLRARLRRRAAAPLSGRRRETMIEVYASTLACIREIKRGMLVRRLSWRGRARDRERCDSSLVRKWQYDHARAQGSCRDRTLNNIATRSARRDARAIDCGRPTRDNCVAEPRWSFGRIIMRVKSAREMRVCVRPQQILSDVSHRVSQPWNPNAVLNSNR